MTIPVAETVKILGIKFDKKGMCGDSWHEKENEIKALLESLTTLEALLYARMKMVKRLALSNCISAQ